MVLELNNTKILVTKFRVVILEQSNFPRILKHYMAGRDDGKHGQDIRYTQTYVYVLCITFMLHVSYFGVLI